MTTNRELLELAAKAAGIERGSDRFDCGVSITLPSGRHDSLPQWNPLTDDGDALRLAVKLGFRLSIGPAGCMVNYERRGPEGDLWVEERRVGVGPHDINEATRRAIVRAAAEIGRTM